MKKEEKTRRYEFDGVVLHIPLYYDRQADMYIEEYPDFIEHPVWTREGYPVMFSGEDACPYSEWNEPGRCMDCGSCLYYTPVTPHTLMGVCRHALRRRGNIRKENAAGDTDADDTHASDHYETT